MPHTAVRMPWQPQVTAPMKTAAEIDAFAVDLNAVLNKHGLRITQACGNALWIKPAACEAAFKTLARSGAENAWVICRGGSEDCC